MNLPEGVLSSVCRWLQDEISTGLDSSTTFLITKCIRNFVHMQDVRTLEPTLGTCHSVAIVTQLQSVDGLRGLLFCS